MCLSPHSYLFLSPLLSLYCLLASISPSPLPSAPDFPTTTNSSTMDRTSTPHQSTNMTNQNTPEYLNKIKLTVFENLRLIPHAPSVPMQSIPEDMIQDPEPTEDDPDERIPQHIQDKMIAREEDLSDSEDEGDGRRNESVGHHDNKRLRLADEGGDNKAPDMSKITTACILTLQSIVLFLLYIGFIVFEHSNDATSRFNIQVN
ncbi:Histone deacetylase 2 [Geodia barretti]|uniref:Histone deacetylase 2 n=1 Tax=Geodia barretti TaxID=519541 RepID=A0AA35SJE7_GEOBA|nr:Histone deacetylase 2 [Geodia barretti]